MSPPAAGPPPPPGKPRPPVVGPPRSGPAIPPPPMAVPMRTGEPQADRPAPPTVAPPPGDPPARSSAGIIAAGVAAGVLLCLAIVIGGGAWWWQSMAPARALAKIQAYADDAVAHPQPTADDIRVALRIAADSPDGIAVSDHLEFLGTVLAGDEVNADAIADADALRDLLDAVAALQEPGGAGDEEIYEPLGVPFDERAARLLAELHPRAFADYDEFRDRAAACRDLVDLAGTEPADRDGREVERLLWADLVDTAEADDAEPRDYARARTEFAATVAEDDVRSLAALVAAMKRTASVVKQPDTKPEQPGPEQTAGGGEKPPTPMPEAQKPPESPKDPAAAFKALRAAMEAFKKDGRAAWPPDRDQGLELFSIPADLTDDLDVDVVVGTRFGFRPAAIRDGAGLSWTIKLGTESVARLTIEDGRVVLRRGDVSDRVWSSHEARLRAMPIAFKRPNVPLNADACFVAATPTLPLKAGDTLHDLLCGDAGIAKPPTPVTPLADATATFRLRTGRIEIAGSPLTLDVVPLADDRFTLTFTAEVDGKSFTLAERMSFDPATGQIHRARGPWTERQARWERFAGATTADVERETLGLVPAGEGWRFRALGSPVRELPIIVGAVLADVGQAGDPVTMMEAWVRGSSEPPKGDTDDKTPTLAEWREAVCRYVAGTNHPFGGIEGAAYEQANPRPADPGPFREPAKKKDEKDDAFKDRAAKAQREHEDKKKRWDAWHAARDTAILAAVADRDRLRRFLLAHPPPAADAERPDPDYAAIHFLLELDSLVVAKTHREALDQLLARVPVAALVAGDATAAGWSLADGGGGTLPISVPAARLLPADVKPPGDETDP